MNRGKYIPIVIALAFISMAFIGSMVSAEGNADDVLLHVSGPDVLAHNSQGHYDITLIDPQDRNWAYSVHIDARNITGASPLEIEPITGNLTAGNDTFSADITAMTNLGEMIMIVNVSSPTGTLWQTREFDINVIEPVVISTKILNSGEVNIKNASVEFYVDDVLISTDTLSYLGAGESTTLTSNWVSEDIDDGWHTSTIIVDVNDDGIIDPIMGDIKVSEDFFVEGSNVSATLFILIGISALLIGMILINKKLAGKRK